jgi:hypothetical protein
MKIIFPVRLNFSFANLSYSLFFKLHADNPIDLDEEMMIPQRPTISDYYKDVRHEWKEPDLTKSGKLVADTSDEESNLPGDPIDLDEEMMLPQKHMVKEIYETLPGHQQLQQHKEGEKKKEGCTCNETMKNKNTAGTSTDCGAAVPGSKEMPEVVEPKHGAREEKMVEAEEDVTVSVYYENQQRVYYF